MAKKYFEKLTALIGELNLASAETGHLEVRHFFSGAAVYADGHICASWSPAGLAFKLPDKEADKLIENGEAIPLRYFPGGHIKQGYAAFKQPDIENMERWRSYLMASISNVETGS